MKKYITILIVVLLVAISSQIVKAETYTDNLSVGATGPQVESLQTWLESNGYLIMPPGVAKGYFGAKTRIALMNYQKFLGLPNTGFFGPLTRAHFNKNTKVSSLTVTSPNGGENWAKGSYHTITWNAPQYFRATNVDISLRAYTPLQPPCPAGFTCTLNSVAARFPYVIATNISVDQHAYVWRVGEYSDPSDNNPNAGIKAPIIEGEYTIQICETGTTVCDSSDKPFVISKEQKIKPAVTVTSPNGGEKWPIKSVHQIAWTNTDMSATSKVDIYLNRYFACLDSNPACAIATPAPIVLDKNIPTNQIYNWIVGTDMINNPISAGDYKMMICVAGTMDTCDSSDKQFSLVAEQSPLVFTATTDKKIYTQNEEIKIHLESHNFSDKNITLYFLSGCETSYSIASFNSWEGAACTANIPQVTINANSSYSWDVIHSPARYRIPLGNQTVSVYSNAIVKNPFSGTPLDYQLPAFPVTVPIVITQ